CFWSLRIRTLQEYLVAGYEKAFLSERFFFLFFDIKIQKIFFALLQFRAIYSRIYLLPLLRCQGNFQVSAFNAFPILNQLPAHLKLIKISEEMLVENLQPSVGTLAHMDILIHMLYFLQSRVRRSVGIYQPVQAKI